MSRNLVPTAAQGIVAGLILYLTVAAFFAGVDLLAGRSLFHTFQRLGEPLMATRPVVPGPEWRWMAWITFNGFHLGASLLLGVAAAFLARGAGPSRRARWIFPFVLVVGSGVMIVGLHLAASDLAGFLPWHRIATAHLAAGVTTTAYLLWAQTEGSLSEERPGQDPGDS